MFFLFISAVSAFLCMLELLSFETIVRRGARQSFVGALPKDKLSGFAAVLRQKFAANKFIHAMRQKRIQLKLADSCDSDMPELLDILSLCLSAGLSFDASLEMYCAYTDAPLVGEIRSTMRSWQMGLSSRADALQAMAERVGSVALKRFCTSVCEALSFGSPLAQTLERQADVMRAEQRAQSQERIEQVPIRMLIPLGVLIVPAMLLAILGPLLSSALLDG